MRFSIISFLAAIVILNVAPGYDACGNKLPGYQEQDADTLECYTDSVELEVDSVEDVAVGADAQS